MVRAEVVERRSEAIKTETGIRIGVGDRRNLKIYWKSKWQRIFQYITLGVFSSFFSLSICRYFENYYYYSRPAYQQREYEDRNWYYQPERYDDRPRYGDRNSAYDNRWAQSASSSVCVCVFNRAIVFNLAFRSRFAVSMIATRPIGTKIDTIHVDLLPAIMIATTTIRIRTMSTAAMATIIAIRPTTIRLEEAVVLVAERAVEAVAMTLAHTMVTLTGWHCVRKPFTRNCAFPDRVSNRGYSYSGGSGYGNRPSDRDRYSGNNYDSRYPDDRVYYDRNQGYRGGYEGGRDFRPWDQSYRYVPRYDALDWMRWKNYFYWSY